MDLSDPNHFPAAQDALAAEIMAASGCAERAAICAAANYLTFPDAPDHGLGGLSNEWLAADARTALGRWKEAQAQKEAA